MTSSQPGRTRSNHDRAKSWLALGILLAVVYAIAAVGGAVTAPKITTWYATLAKPKFQPPPAVFAPVWTVLYGAMAIAAWRIWNAPIRDEVRKITLGLFSAQLALNAAWSPVFFGLEAPRAGLAVILLLFLLLTLTVRRFFAVDLWAGLLLVPYLAWVAFAALLNASIVALN